MACYILIISSQFVMAGYGATVNETVEMFRLLILRSLNEI